MAAAVKTVATKKSVAKFLAGVDDPVRREDCEVVVEMMRRITKSEPVMWGTAIIGFGSYRYLGASGRTGDWPITAVSPRKQDLVVYLMTGCAAHPELLEKLGKHRTGSSCLYLKRLADVDLKVLKALITASVKAMRAKHPESR